MPSTLERTRRIAALLGFVETGRSRVVDQLIHKAFVQRYAETQLIERDVILRIDQRDSRQVGIQARDDLIRGAGIGSNAREVAMTASVRAFCRPERRLWGLLFGAAAADSTSNATAADATRLSEGGIKRVNTGVKGFMERLGARLRFSGMKASIACLCSGRPARRGKLHALPRIPPYLPVPKDAAVIMQTGSTNTTGYRIVVTHDRHC